MRRRTINENEGEKVRRRVFSKATSFIFSFSSNSGTIDGNKRLGLTDRHRLFDTLTLPFPKSLKIGLVQQWMRGPHNIIFYVY